MMVAIARPSLIRGVPVVAAVAAGIIAVAAVALLPVGLLETLVWDSGIASLVSVAAPPLGITARSVLAIGGGALAAAITWSTLFLLVGPGGLFARTPARDGVPSVRRADAHPDAPPRRPLSAANLGAPMMAPRPLEREIPADLDQPLAAFDPDAIPAVPIPSPVSKPMPKIAPAIALQPGERIETFALTPPAPISPLPSQAVPSQAVPSQAVPAASAPPVPVPAASPQTIESLLRRLEQGSSRRVQAAR